MAGTLIHGGQPGFVWTLGGVSLCVKQADITVSRNVVDTRTNCGNSQLPGEVSTEISDSGPLGFGAGSDEVTKWTHITATTTSAHTMRPSSATVGAANPLYTSAVYQTQFKISLTPTGEVNQSSTFKLTDTTGYPARTTA